MSNREDNVWYPADKSLLSAKPSIDHAAIEHLVDNGQVLDVVSHTVGFSGKTVIAVLAVEGDDPIAIRMSPKVVWDLALAMLKAVTSKFR